MIMAIFYGYVRLPKVYVIASTASSKEVEKSFAIVSVGDYCSYTYIYIYIYIYINLIAYIYNIIISRSGFSEDDYFFPMGNPLRLGNL